MRAVFAAFFSAGVIAVFVSATPLTRQKRGVGVFSAAGNPYGFGGGAFAGTGFGGMGFFPFFGDGFPFRVMPMPMPVVPQFTFPQFPVFKNWYEGPNVCKEQKIINSERQEDIVPDEWQEGLPSVKTDFSHEQESCQGTGKKYVCVKRVMGNNGEAKIEATKYECCHGFVRDPSGNPGCIESTQSQGSDAKLTPTDQNYYIYTGNSGSSSMKSSGNLDKVPIQ